MGAAVERGGQGGEPGGGQRHADPLPAGDFDSEQLISRHREQHQAPGDGRLGERDRRQRERADVYQPRTQADRDSQQIDR